MSVFWFGVGLDAIWISICQLSVEEESAMGESGLEGVNRELRDMEEIDGGME